MGKSAAVFLDRDGTIMRDVDYCGDPKDVEVFSGAATALRRLKERGYKLIVVTNQSGIGRNIFSEAQYKEVEAEVNRRLGSGLIDATYYCPHLPRDGCGCRKPQNGLVLAAARQHEVDLSRSFMIGDKESDMECGRKAGVKTILVRTGYGTDADARSADFVADDLTMAVEMILGGKS